MYFRLKCFGEPLWWFLLFDIVQVSNVRLIHSYMTRTQSGIQHLTGAISLSICSCNQLVFQCSYPNLVMCPWQKEDRWDCNLTKDKKLLPPTVYGHLCPFQNIKKLTLFIFWKSSWLSMGGEKGLKKEGYTKRTTNF